MARSPHRSFEPSQNESEDRYRRTNSCGRHSCQQLSAVANWAGNRAPGQCARVVYFLLVAFFVGGLARLLSVWAVGPPNGFFVAMTVLELVIPIVAALVQSKIPSNNAPLDRRVP